MTRQLLLALLAILALVPTSLQQAAAQDRTAALVGIWDGVVPSLDPLRLALDVKRDAAGALTADLRSLDQGGQAMPVAVTLTGDQVVFDAARIGARIEGRLSPDGNRLQATFTQGNGSAPMPMFRRAPGAAPPPLPAIVLGAVPTDAAILQQLKSRIDEQKRGVALIVGIVDGQGRRRIVAYGPPEKSASATVNADTQFEIGSITKTFTSLLLTDAVRRGEVALDDPIAKFLPPGVKAPERNGRQITLVDLATHTSGLPRMPTNMQPANPADPYADYPPDKLYTFLNGYGLTRDVGATWEYSNYGAALLGQLLARRAGVPYPALVKARILDPLGMKSTVLAYDAALAGRMAKPYKDDVTPASPWNLDGFAPAGAIRSSVNDMLTLLEAEIGAKPSSLAAAMADQLKVERLTPTPKEVQALGWRIRSLGSARIVWHGGDTGGFSTFAGFDKARKIGVVVLSNSQNGVGDIGMWLLGGPAPAVLASPAPPPWTRPAVPIEATKLPEFTGSFRVSPQLTLKVAVEDGVLTVLPTAQPKHRLIHIGKEEFVIEGVEASVTYRRDAQGKVRGLVLNQGGASVYAPATPGT